jgi:hypothetical protein
MYPVDLVAGLAVNVFDQISGSQDSSEGVRVSVIFCSSFTKVMVKSLCTHEGIRGSGRIASKSFNSALGVGEG